MKSGETGVVILEHDFDVAKVADAVVTMTSVAGTVIKKLSDNEMQLKENNKILVPLSQDETTRLGRKTDTEVKVEGQIIFNDNPPTICKTDIVSFVLGRTLNTEFVPGANGREKQYNEVTIRVHAGVVYAEMDPEKVELAVHEKIDGLVDEVVAGKVTEAVAEKVADAMSTYATKEELAAIQPSGGTPGAPGADGKSAYELAVENGFNGTVEEWLDSLKGEPGTGSGIDLSDYVTEEDLQEAINGIASGGADLSNYAKKSDLDDYAKVGELDEAINIEGQTIALEWVGGYVTANGSISTYTGNDNSIWRTNPVELKANKTYIYTGSDWNMADMQTVALYSGIPVKSSNKIRLIKDNNTRYTEFTVDSDCYAVFSDSTKAVPRANATLKVKSKLKEDIIQLVNDVNDAAITIKCIGDSVTEGMSTNGARTATYGASPYPARLTTILTDNGYKVAITNAGHGGEQTNAIVSRLGAIPIVTTTDITVPADSTDVLIINAKNTSQNKVKSLVGGSLYNVMYTQIASDINPVYIDGRKYNIGFEEGSNGERIIIRRTFDLTEPLTIPSGAVLHLGSKKNADINIIWAGANDVPEFTLDVYKEMIQKAASINSKYIVLGLHIPYFYTKQGFVDGSTTEEKYNNYRTQMLNAFGEHFIDMYREFFMHAMDYALDSGYFAKKTEAEITAIREKLANKVVPAEFTVDGTEGNVHLNEAGYHVVAMLIYDRLKVLQYI